MKKNKKVISFLVLLSICILALLIYKLISIYAIFQSNVEAGVKFKNGVWNIKKEMSNMKRERILEIISDLSNSQGLYGRLLRDIELDPTILDILEEQNFKDSLDLILFI